MKETNRTKRKSVQDQLSFADKQNAPKGTDGRQFRARRLLLKEIVKRLDRISLGDSFFGRSWHIEVDQLTQVEVIKEINSRVMFAQGHAIDVISHFQINEKSIIARSIRMTELWYDFQNSKNSIEFPSREPICIPGFEDLMSVVGHPPLESKLAKRWFIKTLLRQERRIVDYMAHCLQEIGAYRSLIVSPQILQSRKEQIARQKAYAKKHEFVAVNAAGATTNIPFTDPEDVAKSRFSKAYVRLKGLDQWCTGMGLEGFFVTLTLPPSFHPNPSNGNSSWKGSTPEDGRIDMQKKWELFRRRFHEGGGKCYGARVFEPHVDGSIHWHALLYVPGPRVNEFHEKIRAAFGDGVASDIRPIDRSKSAGPSYLIKYLNPALLVRTNGGIEEANDDV